jgi:cyclohexadieny/prephenate dehydrogenase
MWEQFGMRVVTMSADHHDKVLAMTSHLPHLIAYTIVGTATNLEESLKSEVIEFSASGFRDFTRIAADARSSRQSRPKSVSVPAGAGRQQVH